jgi:hypothetical protein
MVRSGEGWEEGHEDRLNGGEDEQSNGNKDSDSGKKTSHWQ